MEMNKKGTLGKKKSGKRMVNQHCLHGRSDPGQMAEGFTWSGADGWIEWFPKSEEDPGHGTAGYLPDGFAWY